MTLHDAQRRFAKLREDLSELSSNPHLSYHVASRIARAIDGVEVAAEHIDEAIRIQENA